METKTYNGWTNYATWRVMLEMGFGDRDDWPDSFDEKPEPRELADSLKDETEVYVDDVMPDDNGNIFVKGWVNAFLDDVSWDEIAEHILADWPKEMEA